MLCSVNPPPTPRGKYPPCLLAGLVLTTAPGPQGDLIKYLLKLVKKIKDGVHSIMHIHALCTLPGQGLRLQKCSLSCWKGILVWPEAPLGH